MEFIPTYFRIIRPIFPSSFLKAPETSHSYWLYKTIYIDYMSELWRNFKSNIECWSRSLKTLEELDNFSIMIKGPYYKGQFKCLTMVFAVLLNLALKTPLSIYKVGTFYMPLIWRDVWDQRQICRFLKCLLSKFKKKNKRCAEGSEWDISQHLREKRGRGKGNRKGFKQGI